MTRTLAAVFDGRAFLPEETLDLKPNTRVQLTVETGPGPQPAPSSFLRVAQSLNLDGPADWSETIEDHLEHS